MRRPHLDHVNPRRQIGWKFQNHRIPFRMKVLFPDQPSADIEDGDLCPLEGRQFQSNGRRSINKDELQRRCDGQFRPLRDVLRRTIEDLDSVVFLDCKDPVANRKHPVEAEGRSRVITREVDAQSVAVCNR